MFEQYCIGAMVNGHVYCYSHIGRYAAIGGVEIILYLKFPLLWTAVCLCLWEQWGEEVVLVLVVVVAVMMLLNNVKQHNVNVT
jgi:hypothetical protein